MRWPSSQLYENKLIAADCVAGHLLCDIEGVENTTDTSQPLVFVDTAGEKRTLYIQRSSGPGEVG